MVKMVNFVLYVFYHNKRRNQLTIYVWAYFWALSSIIMISLSIFMPILQCLNYCSFINSKSSNLSPAILGGGVQECSG